MTSLLAWADAGFGAELLPLCGPRHGCSHPGKIPHLPGWRSAEITSATIATWTRLHRGNVGLRTRRFPAVDLDVEDAPTAAACERAAIAILGSTARRVRANSARRLLLYRLEGAPFAKRILAFTTPAGESAKVEVLADGQQAVVAGVHHTGAAIEWTGGQPTAAALPTISAAGCEALLVALRSCVLELGCTIAGDDADEARRVPRSPTRTRGDDGELAGLALQKISPDVPYDEWIRVGMALHATWPGADGLAQWDAWSSRGEKYPGARTLERHWASFRAGGGVGFGTLVAIARRSSWAR